MSRTRGKQPFALRGVSPRGTSLSDEIHQNSRSSFWMISLDRLHRQEPACTFYTRKIQPASSIGGDSSRGCAEEGRCCFAYSPGRNQVLAAPSGPLSVKTGPTSRGRATQPETRGVPQKKRRENPGWLGNGVEYLGSLYPISFLKNLDRERSIKHWHILAEDFLDDSLNHITIHRHTEMILIYLS